MIFLEDKLELVVFYLIFVVIEIQYSNFYSYVLILVMLVDILLEIWELFEEQLEIEVVKLIECLDNFCEYVVDFIDVLIIMVVFYEQQVFYVSIVVMVVVGVLVFFLLLFVIVGILCFMCVLLLGVKCVEDGDFVIEFKLCLSDEIGVLIVSFNIMVNGLCFIQKIKDIFGQYFDLRVVLGLILDQFDVMVGEKKVVFVYFFDFVDFIIILE